MTTQVIEPLPPLAMPLPRPSFFAQIDRYLAPVLITLILVGGQYSYHILESYSRTFLAIGTSIAAELILARMITGRWPHLASAYITGISVGILIRSPDFWPYALCAAISILSKYAIRYRGRHLWNPSNLGVSAMLFLPDSHVASLSVQWGNNLWPMITIWVLGSIIIGRLRRFHICLTYVVTFLALAGVRAVITGNTYAAEVAPITGPMYQLFIFFMITDPKSTVKSFAGQCLTAFSVGVMETILRLNGVIHAPYYALFIVGPIANFIDLSRTKQARPTPTLTARTTSASLHSVAPQSV